eukprot:GHUV01027706.1.p1 GENE.GHUV01027706.1~~GHUV01027706.1.p1  ORF type:complete len:117 (+),score=27.53 GHUV01027706.1:1404-1754(+)
MLCIIREGSGGSESGQQQRRRQQQEDHTSHSANLWGQQYDQSAAAAAPAAPRDSCSRSGFVHNRDQAVVLIQAGARGYLTRKKLKAQQQHEGQAAVFIQVGRNSRFSGARLCCCKA